MFLPEAGETPFVAFVPPRSPARPPPRHRQGALPSRSLSSRASAESQPHTSRPSASQPSDPAIHPCHGRPSTSQPPLTRAWRLNRQSAVATAAAGARRLNRRPAVACPCHGGCRRPGSARVGPAKPRPPTKGRRFSEFRTVVSESRAVAPLASAETAAAAAAAAAESGPAQGVAPARNTNAPEPTVLSPYRLSASQRSESRHGCPRQVCLHHDALWLYALRLSSPRPSPSRLSTNVYVCL